MNDDALREAARKFADTPEEVEALVAQARAYTAYRIRRGFKICSVCKEKKKPAAFGSDSRESDGLLRVCRLCVAERDRRRRAS